MPANTNELAVQAVQIHLRLSEGFEHLESVPNELADEFEHCWRLQVESQNGEYVLLLLLDENFPYSFPRVAIENGPDLLEWPHLEKNGLLCLLPMHATGDWDKPELLVDYIISQAVALVEHNLSVDLTQEFKNEFLSYWSYACDSRNGSATSILEPVGPSREVSYVQLGSKYYLGESDEQLNTWSKSRRLTNKKIKCQKCLLLWFSEAWVPTQFPASASDLASILEENASESQLRSLAQGVQSGILVAVAFKTQHGVCYAMLRHNPPRNISHGPGRAGGNPLTNGFREKKIPAEILFGRAFCQSAKVNKLYVHRADHAWIHGRDQNDEAMLLREKSIAIVGVGSLGSEVAVLLAKSGVQNIELVDGDSLAWANISRHALGASSVGVNKAVALRDHLGLMLPHLSARCIEHNLTQANETSISRVFSADLVLLLTGDWGLSVFMNREWLKRDRPSNLLLAWMEAHALSSHSVLLRKNVTEGGCIECGFTNTGLPKLSTFTFPGSQLLQVPACGGEFSPYGAVALAFHAGMVAEHAIGALVNSSVRANQEHRILVDIDRERAAIGANWSEQWIGENLPINSSRVRRDWAKSPNCISC